MKNIIERVVISLKTLKKILTIIMCIVIFSSGRVIAAKISDISWAKKMVGQ